MHRTMTADINASPEHVFEIISDLETYSEWLDLVHIAEPAPADSRDAGPAWFITIRAKVGPFARSKRLRMVRSELGDATARFERAELDGREHSAWVMTSTVDEGPSGAVVTMDLNYDGSLLDGPIENILGRVMDSAGKKLNDYATQSG